MKRNVKKSYNRIIEISPDARQITLPDARYYRRNGEYYPSITYVLSHYPKGKFFEDWLKKVGYSGHCKGVDDAIFAISNGAVAVEKHFTSDNDLPGRDNKFAILPEELKQLKNYVDTNIKSEGIIKGVIQVPSDGNPIIMLSDHGTIGGYPKIGVVISADYDKLVQLTPGSKIKFKKVELADAETLFKLYDLETQNLISQI